VINLGTNDSFFKDNFTQADYEAAVTAFIGQIRTAYGDPNLPIVFATGMMGQALSNWAQNAIQAMNDENIYQIRTLTMTRDGHNGHPTIAGHQEAAEQLVSFLWENELAPYEE